MGEVHTGHLSIIFLFCPCILLNLEAADPNYPFSRMTRLKRRSLHMPPNINVQDCHLHLCIMNLKALGPNYQFSRRPRPQGAESTHATCHYFSYLANCFSNKFERPRSKLTIFAHSPPPVGEAYTCHSPWCPHLVACTLSQFEQATGTVVIQGVPKLRAQVHSNIFQASQPRQTVEFLCPLANTTCYNMLQSRLNISP